MAQATESVADRRQRQQIRDAMDRLIAGTAVRSDGKLVLRPIWLRNLRGLKRLIEHPSRT